MAAARPTMPLHRRKTERSSTGSGTRFHHHDGKKAPRRGPTRGSLTGQGEKNTTLKRWAKPVVEGTNKIDPSKKRKDDRRDPRPRRAPRGGRAGRSMGKSTKGTANIQGLVQRFRRRIAEGLHCRGGVWPGVVIVMKAAARAHRRPKPDRWIIRRYRRMEVIGRGVFHQPAGQARSWVFALNARPDARHSIAMAVAVPRRSPVRADAERPGKMGPVRHCHLGERPR